MPYADPEAKRASDAARYRRNREKLIAQAKARYEANRELRLEQVKAYYEANKDKIRERDREPARARVALRKARKLEAFVEDVQPLVVLERDDGVCGICGGDVDPTDFHVDHVVPLACGGDHSYENSQASHPACNVQKGARMV